MTGCHCATTTWEHEARCGTTAELDTEPDEQFDTYIEEHAQEAA